MEQQMRQAALNLSVKEYLELMRGPQQISYDIVIPITVVYIIIFVSGVIGNVIVCLVIARNASFQTPTNYYLFSLAISDLLILLFGLPNDLKVYWQQYPWIFGETVCKLRAFVAEMTSYASVLTIVAFSTERYLAICHPLLIQTVSSLSRTIKILTTVWMTSCLCAIPFAVFTQVNYLFYPNGTESYLSESAFCALPMDNNDISLPLVQFSSIVFFCLPMTLIVIIYVKIGLRVRKSHFSRMGNSECSSTQRSSANGQAPVEGANGKSVGRTNSKDSRQPPARRSINKMLIAVVIAFFVCWAPFHTQRLFACFFDPNEWTRELRQLNEILFYTGGCLYYFSATINPILYSLISVRYREAFRDALCGFGTTRHGNQSQFNKYSHRPSDTCIVVSEKPTRTVQREDTLVVKSKVVECEGASLNGTSEPLPLDGLLRGNNAEKNARPINVLLRVRERICKLCLGSRRKATCSPGTQPTEVPVIKVTSASPEITAETNNVATADSDTNINSLNKNPPQNSAVRVFQETTV